MIWTKLSIDTSCEAVDLISAFLDELGVEGVMVEDNVPLSEEDLKTMYVDIPLITGEDDGSAKVSCFVDDSFDIESLKADIASELTRLEAFIPVGTKEITISKTDDDSNWQNNWKQYFKPFRLEDNIVILPTWETYDDIKEDDIVVAIESVLAFGTGTHETTKLCIGQIKKYLKEGQSIFDVGCGSGILSIIGVYLGAGYVHGMDIDEIAVKASHENAAANGFDRDRIDFTCGNLLDGETHTPDRKYDIVVANILADVIMPLSGVIRPYMAENGLFITSGIIDTKEEEVKEALIQNGFQIVDVIHMNDWVSIVAR
jgi:ribosomal protein L11 methyltransferase